MVVREIRPQSWKDVLVNLLACGHGKRPVAYVGAALLALAVGCTTPRSVSQPISEASQFSPVPGPPIYDGNVKYTPIFGPVTGHGSKTFTIPAKSTYLVWLACLGSGGIAEFKSTKVAGPEPGWSCGSSGRASGDYVNMARASAGQKVPVEITAPQNATWELRIDAAPQAR